MLRVSFIGTGNMGEHMAANIAKAGFIIKVYDINHPRAASVASRIGATVAKSLTDVADCDICITMLPTSDTVQEVLIRGDDGAFLRHAAPKTVVIDMSSSQPTKTIETGRLLAEKGIVLIDAPVSGGVARAENRTLAIMIGSNDEAALESVVPVLGAMGQKLFRVGRLGAGDAMKAANNFVAAAGYAAAAEALAMGKAFGLDPKLMVEILNVSTGRSFITEVLIKDHVLTGRYASGFALGLLAKDVGIAARMGEDLELDVPMCRLVHERYQQAQDRLGSTCDNSQAIRAWYEQLWEE
jgi:3-hydroxyisobutyrate dehydrogenase